MLAIVKNFDWIIRKNILKLLLTSHETSISMKLKREKSKKVE